MKRYLSIQDAISDRRKGALLSEVFDSLLAVPDMWLPYGKTPFSILETLHVGDYLDCTTPVWLLLSHADQVLFATAYQHWYAHHSGHASIEGTFDLSPRVETTMMFIPPTKYLMGSSEEEYGHRYGDEFQHAVLINRPFWMGKYEVTQAQYTQVMGGDPSYFNDRDPDVSPVERVTWLNCESFCKKTKTRLPTEAEWEMACRAGTTGAFYFGDIRNINDYVYFSENSDRPGPINSKNPNGWGLYHMSGNVWEVCADNLRFYDQIPETINPIGFWKTSTMYIHRGGSFREPLHILRSARRGWGERNVPYDDMGFRVCKDI